MVIDQTATTLHFDDVDTPVVPSLLRGFSAPVVLDDGLGDAELGVLLRHDTDPFVRWEAGQRMALNRLLAAVRAEGPVAFVLDDTYLDAMRALLDDPQADAAFKDLVLTLPSAAYVGEQLAELDPPRVHAAREAMRLQLAQRLRDTWARGPRDPPGGGRLPARPGVVGPACAREPGLVDVVPGRGRAWRSGLARPRPTSASSRPPT